ncbi:MAG: tRNA dihydrouridine synthase DusB, partial [Ruminococcaceae bacterium]|nr:tRNA dihydrouridine synthase DusB [Oscillospiraceae bacterium]
MAGVTDAAFRALCRSYGAVYTVSEMVSVKGLTFGDRKSRQLLALGEDELPALVELVRQSRREGWDRPRLLREAAKLEGFYVPSLY